MDFASLWWQLSLLYSFILAVNFGSNGFFKADGLQLTFLRSFVAGLFLFACLPFAQWPDETHFYIYAVLAILPAVAGDILMYNAAAKYGGAVIARILPLRIWLLFIAWSMFVPSSFEPLLDVPLRLAGIILSLVVGVFSLFMMRKDPVNREALKVLVPVVLLYVVMDMFYKPATVMAPDFSQSLALGFIMCLVMWVASGLYIAVTGRYRGLADKKMLVAGAVTGFIYIFVILGKNLAMIGSPNPAYFTAISMLCAVWLTFYHRVRGIPDTGDIRLGLVFVASTFALILLTA